MNLAGTFEASNFVAATGHARVPNQSSDLAERQIVLDPLVLEERTQSRGHIVHTMGRSDNQESQKEKGTHVTEPVVSKGDPLKVFQSD